MKVVALAGGVGGAKLVDGLASILPDDELTVVVNTGDDFTHLGLYICPDLDTICYTLAGLANPTTGWGRADETWNALDSIGSLGGPTWFRLGDKDLGLHLERTRRLQQGEKLSAITSDFCHRWGISQRIYPMSDDRVPTWVYTDVGELPFQEYFVHRQCRPVVSGFRFADIDQAHPVPEVVTELEKAELIIICPSNPWVSVDPILSIPGIKSSIEAKCVVAVSPIVGGKALKGPAAKMYSELGINPSAFAVAQHYGQLLAGFVIDHLDVDFAGELIKLGIHPYVTDTIMRTRRERRQLAETVLEFALSLRNRPDQEE